MTNITDEAQNGDMSTTDTLAAMRDEKVREKEYAIRCNFDGEHEQRQADAIQEAIDALALAERYKAALEHYADDGTWIKGDDDELYERYCTDVGNGFDIAREALEERNGE